MKKSAYSPMFLSRKSYTEDNRPVSLSVFMISYNQGKYIDEAISSVLRQKTNFPVNIVIHDDASTDDSPSIIMRYAAENPNITPIIQKKNIYQAGKSMLPFVLPYLTGKYIAYCECDDFWIDDEKLQRQADYLESNPDCSAVYSNTLPVNKFSEYDESARDICFPKTPEGDYPNSKLMWVKHQLASLMHRNFYALMSPEELQFMAGIRANLDEKLMSISLMMGRVHYFAEELAAHRRVVDEGNSYSARMARTSNYDKEIIVFKNVTELMRMIERFGGKKYPGKYFMLLKRRVIFFIKYRRDIMKEAKLEAVYREIPLWIYFAFAVCLPFLAVRKIVRKTVNMCLRNHSA